MKQKLRLMAALWPILTIMCLEARAQRAEPFTVTGNVVSAADGRAIEGATITDKQTGSRVISDESGGYRIFTKPGHTLIYSFIGHRTAQERVNDRKLITVALDSVKSILDEVFVIGYGQTSRRFNTGSVSRITAKDIEKQPVSNPLLLLQGRLPGVHVSTGNGLPGGNVNMTIRGRGSIAAGTNPLYIVDGVPFLSEPLQNDASNGANGPVSPLSILDIGNIESIEVLKDADATAIYGSRGANGVVLITTKKGRAGANYLQADYSHSISGIADRAEYLNLPQYLQLRRDAFANSGTVPTEANAPDLMVWDTTRAVNWMDEILQTSNADRASLTLNGGTDKLSFLASANFSTQSLFYKQGDFRYTKGGGYLSVNHWSADGKLRVSLSTAVQKDKNFLPYQGLTSTISTMPPHFPIVNEDGSFNFTLGSNVLADYLQHSRQHTGNLIANLGLQWEVWPQLTLSTNAGYRSYDLHTVSTQPLSSLNPSYYTAARSYFSDHSSNAIVVEPRLDYVLNTAPGPLSLMVGATMQQNSSTGQFISGTGVTHPSLLGNLGSVIDIDAKNNAYSRYRYVSLYSRVNYNIMARYLINLTFRTDGSSKFGPANRYGNFASAGLGWIFSEEAFVKRFLPLITFGKIRMSYGITGNDQIPDFQYIASYGSGSEYLATPALVATRIANTHYRWETNRKLEGALEIGIWDDRLHAELAFYRNKSNNQLVSYTLPSQSGFSSYQANLPAVVENKGVEALLDAQLIDRDRLRWKVGLNLTFPQNKLVAFPNIEQSSYAAQYVVGQDLTVIQRVRLLGVNPQTGAPEYEDLNGDGVISYAGDKQVVGKGSPDFFGGVSNEIAVGKIAFSFLVEYVNQSSLGLGSTLGRNIGNNSIIALDRWRKPGDKARLPKASMAFSDWSRLNNSDAFFYEASYARLKNVAITYELSHRSFAAAGIEKFTVYAEGQNLLTISAGNKTDPELSATLAGFPPVKTMNVGLRITF